MNTSCAKNIALLLLSCSVSTYAFAAKPGPSNTGPSGSLTPYSGPSTITTDGTVLENFRYNGMITIRANDVTLRNCLIDGGYNGGPTANGSRYGVDSRSSHTGKVIEDCEIRNAYSAGIISENTTIRRNHIHGMGADAIKPWNNDKIQDNWIEKLGTISGSHADGIQCRSGSNYVVTGNFIDARFSPHAPGYKGDIAILFQAADGPISNVTIEGNWLWGGNYSTQLETKGHSVSNFTLHNNVYDRTQRYGQQRVTAGVNVTCNRFEDNLAFLDGQSSISSCPPGPSDDDQPEPDPQPVAADAPARPSLVPGGGVFPVNDSVSVSMTADSGNIYYTTDGTDPTTTSTRYQNPVQISATTSIRARAFVDGISSEVSEASYVFGAISPSTTWQSIEVDESTTNSYILRFEARPESNSIDSVVGLGGTDAQDYGDLAAIVRFAPNGEIDVRNGASYESKNEFRYQNGTSYEITMTVNLATKRYSVWVNNDQNNTSVQLADSYEFREEQSALNAISHISMIASDGGLELSDISANPVLPSAPISQVD